MSTMSSTIITHAHGITRTFADITIANNNVKGYTSPFEVIDDIFNHFERLAKYGDEVAEIALRVLIETLESPDVFVGGHLNDNALRNKIERLDLFEKELEKVYFNHCSEKLCNIISYLNSFKHYASKKEVMEDLSCSEDLYLHLGNLMSPMRGGDGYPFLYLQKFLDNNWSEICTDGILDNEKLEDKLFNQHNKRLMEYGLAETIHKFYIRGNDPCHPEPYSPIEIGTAPIYIENKKKFLPSCGNGVGINATPNSLEYRIVSKILEKDDRYIRRWKYLLPKDDMELPVFSDEEGIIDFDSFEKKIKFIDDCKRWYK